MMEFTVAGEPVGKGRPRFGKGRAYTPKNTVDYEKKLKSAWLARAHGFRFPEGVPLAIEITAVYGVPKSDSKKKQAEKLANQIRPTKKPDWDNVGKIVADALNGLAYHDDSQIVFAAVTKKYGAVPCVKIKITEVSAHEDT